MSSSRPDYRVDHVMDTLAGVSFDDPDRWLEETSAETREWQRTQSERASAFIHEWPHREQLMRQVARFSGERFFDQVVLPRFSAGRWFRTHAEGRDTHARVVVSQEPFGRGRVLFDPHGIGGDRPPFLSWIVPSPDGKTLAIGLCADGSENNTIKLIDTATGKVLDGAPTQVLMDSNTGGVHWLPDSSGFFLFAITGDTVQFEQDVYLHTRLPTPKTTRLSIPWVEGKDYRVAVVSRDGRSVVAYERCLNTIPVAIAELGTGSLTWRPFITRINGTVAGHVIADQYIAITDLGAPRGRVVSIPLSAADPSDPRGWRELVPESEAALRSLTLVGDFLYLTEFVDTYTRVRILDLHGNPHSEVPLPGRGTIVSGSLLPMLDVLPKGAPHQFIFAYSSLTVSPAIYSHTPGDDHVLTLQEPRVRLENAVVEEKFATSADGTRIPYHIVRRGDVDLSHPKPTLMHAYGGYNIPFVPEFPGPMAAFVLAGGVYVHAHLRGGGELGLEWWQAGRMANKQRCYEDLYAIAEHLIIAGHCLPSTLALTGESNGGLMAGVALTQRPDLWAAVVPRVPLLDLIGACRFPYGRWAVTMELADADDPADVRRLATFSPYHLIREGIGYPAVYVDAGDTDPRCPPWHARKFIARLQRANARDVPVLLHVWENTGHGPATDKTIAVNEHTEWLGFVMRILGMCPGADE